VQVDSALSEIHQSITELAVLLHRDEVASQLVRTVPTQWQLSPASSVASGRQSLLSDCGAQGSHQKDAMSSVLGQGTVKLLASASDYLSDGHELQAAEQPANRFRSQSHEHGDNAIGNWDLSYDLSMSYSVLGTSRAAGVGHAAFSEQSAPGTDDVDLTIASLNLSHDDAPPLTGKPMLEESGLQFEAQRHVMGDCSHALQQSAQNISVTVSDVTGSLHDTCELSRCEASKCSPSPARCSQNQITPKLLNASTMQILSPAAPPKAGLGIKFKQLQRGMGFPVAAVVPGGPADCAGISPGDILMFVSRNTMTTESSSKLVAMSIAQGGTALHIILRRGSRLNAVLVRRSGPGATTIGTAIAKDPSRNPHVCSVASGSPAEEAGIFAGDEVVAVGSQCVAHLERQDLLEMLAGDAGSLVVLGLLRHGTAGGLEWVALRRRAGVPLTVSESNAIVPKTITPLLAHAMQQNQYVERKDQSEAHDSRAPFGLSSTLSSSQPAATPPRNLYTSHTHAAHAVEDKRENNEAQRAADSTIHATVPKSQQGTYVHCGETGTTGSGVLHGEPARAISADPQLHFANRDPQLYLSHARSNATPSRLSDTRADNVIAGSGTVTAGSGPRCKQPPVLQRTHVPHASLRQPVVAVGGATVSMGADLFALRQSAVDDRSAPPNVSPNPAYSSHGGVEAAARGDGGKTLIGLPVETLLKSSRQSVPNVSATRAAAPHPAEAASRTGRTAAGAVVSRASSSSGESRISVGARSGTLYDTKSAQGTNQLEGARGGKLYDTRAALSTKELGGDALVAAALHHIHKYESRKEKVVKTEHSRRLDADIA
jgi:hypothetical protein